MASKGQEVGKGAKLKDSNMANYGGKGHHDLREGAAASEKAWKGAGKKPGVEVWRVENEKAKASGSAADFGVKKWPKSKYGTFYDGDSFIVLHTRKEKGSDKLLHDIHFWLGLKSTQDELGVAAYKAVELDDLLNGDAIQYRVTQGHEPQRFTKLFNKPLLVLSGGHASGFNHVKSTEYKPRLLWVKGKAKNLRVQQCDPHATSMNHGDVFVLDVGLKLYQWNGAKSGPFERNKASAVITGIRDDRLQTGTKSTYEVIEDDGHPEPEFWKALGGSLAEVPEKAMVRRATGEMEELKDTEVKERANGLFRCSDKGGTLKFTKEGEGALSKGMLDSKDVFIVDARTEIFVWIGKKASKRERAQAFPLVAKFMKERNLAHWTPVTRVIDGARTPSAFDRAFSGEGKSGETTDFTKEADGCCVVS